mmetsp:Transcript_38263/g.70023  ORF Transcript_38263/g.70023 Transcript_38263/m.70023 type:complete len:335 (+) Transcript_38263:138-1142(+)
MQMVSVPRVQRGLLSRLHISSCRHPLHPQWEQCSRRRRRRRHHPPPHLGWSRYFHRCHHHHQPQPLLWQLLLLLLVLLRPRDRRRTPLRPLRRPPTRPRASSSADSTAPPLLRRRRRYPTQDRSRAQAAWSPSAPVPTPRQPRHYLLHQRCRRRCHSRGRGGLPRRFLSPPPPPPKPLLRPRCRPRLKTAQGPLAAQLSSLRCQKKTKLQRRCRHLSHRTCLQLLAASVHRNPSSPRRRHPLRIPRAWLCLRAAWTALSGAPAAAPAWLLPSGCSRRGSPARRLEQPPAHLAAAPALLSTLELARGALRPSARPAPGSPAAARGPPPGQCRKRK